ncbi:hypothetical protein PWG15_35780 (plasmid) [Ensifer adhaerens]|uniref:hypothetical protein n=1 Tax=Ensifer adhaerens TaxID=106592 RepID=UPI0023A9F819|nr:hypothetical protein [Ensifer adhaerens]WDZ81684.1 hypothetical protein PWG15_35780 [Ensifer adhaerens]
MEDDRMTITAQFQGVEISLVSREPLLGTLELTSITGANIEVPLDYYSAEALVSALVQFLAQGSDDRQTFGPTDTGDLSF